MSWAGLGRKKKGGEEGEEELVVGFAALGWRMGEVAYHGVG